MVSTFILFIYWKKLAASLAYDFPPKTTAIFNFIRRWSLRIYVQCSSFILSGTSCAFSIGLAKGTEGDFGSSYFSSSAVIKLLQCSTFNSLFTSAWHILVGWEFTGGPFKECVTQILMFLNHLPLIKNHNERLWLYIKGIITKF